MTIRRYKVYILMYIYKVINRSVLISIPVSRHYILHNAGNSLFTCGTGVDEIALLTMQESYSDEKRRDRFTGTVA